VGVKRKSDDLDPTSPGSPTSPGGQKVKVKKVRNLGPLTEEMIIEWLKTAQNPTTLTCIEKFRKYISTGATSRDEFTAMIKRLAKVVGGELTLRPQYLDGAAK
jgi:transcription initiation factor TFIIF subunit alpha